MGGLEVSRYSLDGCGSLRKLVLGVLLLLFKTQGCHVDVRVGAEKRAGFFLVFALPKDGALISLAVVSIELFLLTYFLLGACSCFGVLSSSLLDHSTYKELEESSALWVPSI